MVGLGSLGFGVVFFGLGFGFCDSSAVELDPPSLAGVGGARVERRVLLELRPSKLWVNQDETHQFEGSHILNLTRGRLQNAWLSVGFPGKPQRSPKGGILAGTFADMSRDLEPDYRFSFALPHQCAKNTLNNNPPYP